MLHPIYKWLYERSQKRQAFKLPGESHGKMGLGFGDYINSQSRIGSLGAYDLLNRRKKRLKTALVFIAAAVLIWLGIQLIQAIEFYST